MLPRTPATVTLEILQEAAYRELGRTPRTFNLDDAQEILRDYTSKIHDHYLDELLEQIGSKHMARRVRGMRQVAQHISPQLDQVREISAVLPTKYENPFHYYILKQIQEKIAETVSAYERGGRKWSHDANPIIGTLPTRLVNARALHIPESGEQLLIFDSEMFNFVIFMSKSFAGAVSPTTQGDFAALDMRRQSVLQKLNDDPEVITRFREAVLAYLIEGHFENVPPYSHEGQLAAFSNHLCTATELFIVGHEYGHLLHGDFSDKQRSVAFVVEGRESLEFPPDWSLEFSADVLGADLASMALQVGGDHRLGSFIGAFFSFNV
jgi:hypothetical protein